MQGVFRKTNHSTSGHSQSRPLNNKMRQAILSTKPCCRTPY